MFLCRRLHLVSHDSKRYTDYVSGRRPINDTSTMTLGAEVAIANWADLVAIILQLRVDKHTMSFFLKDAAVFDVTPSLYPVV